MTTPLKIALFGAVLMILSTLVFILAMFHVVTIDVALANCVGLSLAAGALIMLAGFIMEDR